MSAELDTEQIAKILGVSRAHVTDKLTKRSDFPPPSINVSRRIRKWRECDIRAWMSRQSKRAAMSEAGSL